MYQYLTPRRVAGAVFIGAVALGAALLQPSRPATAAPSAAALTSGFQDKSSGAYLRVQLDSTQANYGSFAVALPGTGLAWSAGPLDIEPKSDHSDQLRYQGAGYLQAQAQLDTEFGVNYQTIGAVQDESLRIVGQIDPAHGTGSIELWLNTAHYHFGAAAAPQYADTAVSAYLAAIKTEDWAALYALGDDSLKNETNEASFAQIMAANLPLGAVKDARTAGSITYTTSAAGISYATVPITITTSAGPSPGAQNGSLELIYNGGQWRVFSVT